MATLLRAGSISKQLSTLVDLAGGEPWKGQSLLEHSTEEGVNCALWQDSICWNDNNHYYLQPHEISMK